MKYRNLSYLDIVTTMAATLMAALATTQASGQVSATSLSPGNKVLNPRTPDGQADLQGSWNSSTITPMERPRDLAVKESFASEAEARAYEQAAYARSKAGLDNGIGSYNEAFYE